jgi:hypothetical protein
MKEETIITESFNTAVQSLKNEIHSLKLTIRICSTILAIFIVVLKFV